MSSLIETVSICCDGCVGLQLSNDMAVIRVPDPVCLCSVVYCHRIDERGDRGKFGTAHVLGCRDTENR